MCLVSKHWKRHPHPSSCWIFCRFKTSHAKVRSFQPTKRASGLKHLLFGSHLKEGSSMHYWSTGVPSCHMCTTSTYVQLVKEMTFPSPVVQSPWPKPLNTWEGQKLVAQHSLSRQQEGRLTFNSSTGLVTGNKWCIEPCLQKPFLSFGRCYWQNIRSKKNLPWEHFQPLQSVASTWGQNHEFYSSTSDGDTQSILISESKHSMKSWDLHLAKSLSFLVT